MLISAKEYAEKNGKRRDAIVDKCRKGSFKTARKIGNFWFIDSDEPYVDNRIKDGLYIKKEK
jgi:hypothetical protein